MDEVRQGYDQYSRLVTTIEFGGVTICKNILFNVEKLPMDGTMLYHALKPHKTIARFKGQYSILFPHSGYTDISKFDLILFLRVIEVMFGSKYIELVLELRSLRNSIHHRGSKRFFRNEFDKLWNNTMAVLEKHGFDLTLINEFRWEDNVIFISQGSKKSFYW